jgi:glycosyltransferase involved in cell wall biosynthesis
VRICLISREYPPETHVGGIASYTHKTAAALARLGHEAHVITASGGAAAEYVENGVTVHRFVEPTPRIRQLTSLAHARRVAAMLDAIPGRFDVVQACEFGGEACWYAAQPRRPAPLVTRLATPHFVVDRLNHQSPLAMRGLLARTLERLQTYWSDGLISPTRSLADIVARGWHIAPDRITVVPTGMDAIPAGVNLDGPLPVALGGAPYLLYFGRLEERKGVHVLAQALPAILGAHPELKAVFIGDDFSYRGESMRGAIEAENTAHADRLLFMPRMPQRDLFPIIAGARLVVLPSLWENLANTCLEAMQLGRPIVATLGCGFGEVMEDGVSGLLVPPGDAEALAGRVVDALNDLALLERVGQGARRRVGDFAIDAMAERLVGYYAEVVARWRRTPALRAVATRPEAAVDTSNAARDHETRDSVGVAP